MEIEISLKIKRSRKNKKEIALNQESIKVLIMDKLMTFIIIKFHLINQQLTV